MPKNQIPRSMDGFALGKKSKETRGRRELRGFKKNGGEEGKITVRNETKTVGPKKKKEAKPDLKIQDKKTKPKKKEPKLPEKDKKADPKKKSKRRKWYIIGLLAVGVLAIVGSLVYVFFIRGSNFTGDNINIRIDGPSQVTSGDQVKYTIRISNQEKVNLENLALDLIYPDGFTFESATPATDSFGNSRFELGNLAAGEETAVEINGKMIGEADESKRLTAVLEYQPKNLSQTFNREESITTDISMFPVDLDVAFPSKVFAGGEVEFTIDLVNKSVDDVSDLQLQIDYPTGFDFKSSTPSPSQYKNVWQIAGLDSREREEIKVKGVLAGDDGDRKEFKIELGMIDDKSNFFVQKDKTAEVSLVAPSVELAQSVDDKTEDVEVNPGDTLEYKIHYKNTGKADLTNVIVETTISKKVIDEGSIEVLDGNYEDSKVTWDKNSIDRLEKVEPDQEGDLIFRVKISDPININDLNDKDLAVAAKTTLRTEDSEEVMAETTTLSAKIGTKITLKIEPHYYDFDGEQIGDGPLPPKVGETTKYRVYVLVSNSTSDVGDGRITINLPTGAAWTGQTETSIGHLTFDSGQIIWDIGSIKAHTGTLIPRIEASFEIGITPISSQVGQFVTLIDKGEFVGKDSFLNKTIDEKAENITTDLQDDEKAKGKGKVQP